MLHGGGRPMPKTTTEHVETYYAVDAEGKRHQIRVLQDFIHSTAMDGTTERLAGLKAHKMSNGNHVNVNSDGTLEEVATGRTLRRV
jgi:hypothetical protein